MIVGILAKKIGMTQLFIDGKATPVTAVQAGPCYVTQVKTEAVDGYEAVQIGFDEVRKRNKPERGHQRRSGKLLRHLREFEVEGSTDELPAGTRLDATLFTEGEKVDVIGSSKGHGFSGVIKRHGFSGAPKTHGQSDRWRAPGSIGAGTFPAKVIKGKKMPGHFGAVRVTTKNLTVVRVDPERSIIYVRGAVPGASNGLLMVQRSVTSRQRRQAGK